MSSTIRIGQNKGYILSNKRFGQNGGYILPTTQNNGELQVDPLKGYVFIADPGEGGT